MKKWEKDVIEQGHASINQGEIEAENNLEENCYTWEKRAGS